MSDQVRLSGTTVNAPDALALATFYAELTGGVTKGSAHWATVSGPNGFIAFQQVDDFRPPVWPGAVVPMQMHLDFFVDDLEATGARAVEAGATRLRLPAELRPLSRVRRSGRPSVLPVHLGRSAPGRRARRGSGELAGARRTA
jgi:hypothetical protein